MLFSTPYLGSGATHSGLCLPTTINKLDNSPQTCPRLAWSTYSSLGLSSWVTPGCVKLAVKTSQGTVSYCCLKPQAYFPLFTYNGIESTLLCVQFNSSLWREYFVPLTPRPSVIAFHQISLWIRLQEISMASLRDYHSFRDFIQHSLSYCSVVWKFTTCSSFLSVVK